MSLSHLIGVLLIGLMVNKLPGFARAEFAISFLEISYFYL